MSINGGMVEFATFGRRGKRHPWTNLNQTVAHGTSTPGYPGSCSPNGLRLQGYVEGVLQRQENMENPATIQGYTVRTTEYGCQIKNPHRSTQTRTATMVLRRVARQLDLACPPSNTLFCSAGCLMKRYGCPPFINHSGGTLVIVCISLKLAPSDTKCWSWSRRDICPNRPCKEISKSPKCDQQREYVWKSWCSKITEWGTPFL
jgi:hypothetical protein